MSLVCPNKSTKEWKDLVAKYGEVNAMLAFIRNGEEIPTITQADFLLNNVNSVNYILKSVNILLSDRAKQVFAKGTKNNWPLDKILTELAIPKEQKQLLLDLRITDREQLAFELAAKYSFAVEMNVATTNPKYENYKEGITDVIKKETYNYWDVSWKDNGVNKNERVGTIQELNDLIKSLKEPVIENTQQHKNLSARNNRNTSKYEDNPEWSYKEIQINTPLIDPSIKGHTAPFNNTNGIGWIRVWTNEKTGEVEVQEIQSDLFQKGRNKQVLVSSVIDNNNYNEEFTLNGDLYEAIEDGENFTKNGKNISRDEYMKAYQINFSKDKSKPENKFLQLLNKDNNWVTFFIKATVQHFAKQGYTTIRFPKGETAAKIEGHETIAEEINNININIKDLQKKKETLEEYTTVKSSIRKYGTTVMYLRKADGFSKNGSAIWTSNINDITDKSVLTEEITKNRHGVEFTYINGVSKNEFDLIHTVEEQEKQIDLEITNLNERKQELKIQGVEKLKPIEAFYEIKVGNILEKQYGKDNVKEVTDEYGNGWREITIDTNRDLKPILLLKSKKEFINPHKEVTFQLKDKELKFQLKDIQIDYDVESGEGNESLLTLTAKVGNDVISQIMLIDTTLDGKQGYSIGWSYLSSGTKFKKYESNVFSYILSLLKSLFTKNINSVSNNAGKGVGTYIYTKLGEHLKDAGLILLSDDKRSESAEALWKKLEKNGYARYIASDNRYEYIGEPTQQYGAVNMEPQSNMWEEYNKLPYNEVAGGVWKEKIFYNRNEAAKEYEQLFNTFGYLASISGEGYSLKEKKPTWRVVIKQPSKPQIKNPEENKSFYDLLLEDVFYGDNYYLENYFDSSNVIKNIEQILSRLERESRLDGRDTILPRASRDVLYSLNKNSYKLKSLQFKIEIKSPDGSMASFNPNTGVITIYTSDLITDLKSEQDLYKRKAMLDRMFIHEISHAFLFFIYDSPQTSEELKFKKEIDKLYKLALNQFQENERNEYGLKDQHEFLAEYLANPIFRRRIKNLKYNIFDRIVNAIVDLLSSLGLIPVRKDIVLDIIEKSEKIQIKVKDNTVKETVSLKTDREEMFEQETHVEESISDTVLNIDVLKKKAVKVLEDRMTFVSKSGKISQASRKEAEEFLTKMREANVTESLTMFIETAYNKIKQIHTEYIKASEEELTNPEKKLITLRQLQRWRDTISYYDVLNEVLYFLKSDEAIKYFPNKEDLQKLISFSQYGVGNKDFVKQLYTTKGIDQLVDFLYPFYSKAKKDFERDVAVKDYNELSDAEKENKTLDQYVFERLELNKQVIDDKAKTTLRQELFRTSGDIGGLGAVLETVLDSKDVITMTLAKAIAHVDYTIQQKVIKAHDEMVEAASLIEKVKDKSMFANTRELYDFMIDEVVVDEDTTEYHIVDKFGGAFWNEYQKFVKELKKAELIDPEGNRLLTPKEQSKEKYAWLDVNAPVNQIAFLEGVIKKAKEMQKNGLLTESNFTSVTNTAMSVYFRGFLDLYEVGEISYEAYEELQEWTIRNKYTFREPTKRWKDQNTKWDELVKHIEANDEIGQFYNAIKKISSAANFMIPPGFRIWGRIPGIMKNTQERIGTGQSVVSSIKDKIKESLDVTVNDTDRGLGTYTDATGKLRRFVPVYFTSVLDKKDQSFDLPSVYFKFYEMAVNYRERSRITPEVELAKTMLENRDIVIGQKEKKKFNEKTGDYELVKEDVVKKGIESNNIKQVTDFINMAIYGVHKKDAGKVLGMDINKLVDRATGYTSITLLAGNLVQGMSNVILGESLQAIEAFASREFISPSSFNKAHWFYSKNIGAVANDAVSRNPKNIISILNRKFNVMNEPVENNVTDATFWQRNLNTSALFFIQHAGEHYMQSRFMLAMLEMIPAYKTNGDRAGSLLDNLIAKNGELILKEGIDSKKSKWTEADQFDFYYKLKGILARLHGEYSEIGKSSIQLMALGRLAIHFRKFIVSGFKRRWDSERYNNRLGDYTEGMYISFGKFIGQLFKETKAFTLHYGSRYDSLSDMQKANVKRTTLELTFFLSMWVLSAALMNMDGDEDDDWLISFLAYQSFRFKAELGFYWNIGEAMKILRSPMASMSTIESLGKLTYQLTFAPADVYERGPWKGHLKLEKYTYDMLPIVRSMYKLRDVEDQLSYFSR